MGYSIPGTLTSLLPASNPTPNKSLQFSKYTLSASIQRNHIPLIGKKVGKRLIRISTAEGKWQGNWNADYNFSLRDLRLDDLVEDGDPNNSRVLVSLTIHRHAGFGLSVDGKIDTSFTRKCSNCSLPYCRQITTNFNVWVLPSNKDGDSNQLPEIGGDDPSVIYVKPGCEADLDSLIQDTVRLTTSVNIEKKTTEKLAPRHHLSENTKLKETCSDVCEKSELGLKQISKENAPTVDKRWSKLLELKKSYK